jgi:hypothetical protein
MEFQVPRIIHEELTEERGIFVIEPLDRGFGYTFGNSLRRVLLSSLEGAAVLPGRVAAPLDGALLREAALALQEELHALAAAELALGADGARH